MSKTKKTLERLNLSKYSVYIEDTADNSEYFQISRFPSIFTGGKNSFLIAGSTFLKEGSEVLIEILDANNKPIYQTIVPNYIEADAKMLSVEVYDTTTTGDAYVTIMGKAKIKSDGTEIPYEWKDAYNVRWTKKVLVDYNLNNTSRIVFKTNPVAEVKEYKFLNNSSGSYVISDTPVSASLNPTLYSAIQVGYSIRGFDNILLPKYINPIITGSLIINEVAKNIYLPITKILNNKVVFTYNHYINSPIIVDGIIKKIGLLKSGSYITTIDGVEYPVTTSAKLLYETIGTSSTNIPISYADIKISNLDTVSGELYKIRVYNKIASSLSNYKLIADVPVVAEELLITSSIQGYLPIGNVSITPDVENNWYSGLLANNLGSKRLIYPLSGSLDYYDSSTITNRFTVSSSSDVLMSAINVNVPVDLSTNKFANQVSESGYFLGAKQKISLLPTTEYTLQLNAFYTKFSGSFYLEGITPKVDIYIVGTTTSTKTPDNPLGQKIGELLVAGESQWFEQKQFNFIPVPNTDTNVGLRFVINNGFWHFSGISIKPANDEQFSPDEVRLLIPNVEYNNELLEYKVEFFDINNNSSTMSATTTPTYFSGSSV